MKTYLVNEEGYYGEFGGAYVPEILYKCVEELKNNYLDILQSEDFKKEFNALLKDYVGRPSPLYLANRLSAKYGCKIYLKREDLNHTGAHKINNAIGQILLAKRLGKKRIIAETGAGQHAPLFSPAMKAVAPIRKNLGVRTFFNMLGPLVNPVMPTYQLLGVYNLPLMRLYSYAYQESGSKFAVVHSLDGYDEISLTSDFKVVDSTSEKIYSPESLGFKRCTEADLYGGDTPEEAAQIFDNVLNNKATDAQKNCVIVNAAFAIQVICPEKSIEECIAIARQSLESGKAMAKLKQFVQLNS